MRKCKFTMKNDKMKNVFSLIFVADKIIFSYNFVAPLISFCNLFSTDKFDLSNFLTVCLFQFQTSFKELTKNSVNVAKFHE